MTMDCHDRFRTDAHDQLVPRFNERFILSLSKCNACLVLDDELNILPISSRSTDSPAGLGVDASSAEGAVAAAAERALDEGRELAALVRSLADAQPAGAIVAQCKTLDQVGSRPPPRLCAALAPPAKERGRHPVAARFVDDNSKGFI